ncbi:HD domain-containing protein [Candidatus Micrarchaeota archaeon]|nr:HD domain-containing protein [Candidatus Micrarchaeota archaeon]
MDTQTQIELTRQFVEQFLEGESSGHDYWHIHRVWQMAKKIVSEEKIPCDLFVVEMAALLHDIADQKLHHGDEEKGRILVVQWLDKINVSSENSHHIMEIIQTLSFKGSNVRTDMETIEGKIVQDADRLDAIGAIGIARAFAYGGSRGRPLYDPKIKPQKHDNYEQYKSSYGPTVNHFYEKLLLLKDRMNTETAKKIAIHRHKFMEKYLSEFYGQWDGKK